MIVFLDDEPERIQDYVEVVNREFPGQVSDYVDIKETLELVSDGNVDVLILDIMMPPGLLGMDKTEAGLRTGMVVYEKVRDMKQGAELPVIILTNVRNPNVVDYFQKQKNCWFFSKQDLVPRGLTTKIKEILSR